MAINRTQCGWMALGGMLCLFGVGFVCKARDNQASAQSDPLAAALAVPPPAVEVPRESPPPPYEPKPTGSVAVPLTQIGEPSQPLPPIKIPAEVKPTLEQVKPPISNTG